MEPEKKGAWQSFKDFFYAPYEEPAQYRSQPVGTSGLLPGVVPPRRETTRFLDERTAMGVPGLSRAVAVIGGTMCQLPPKTYRQGLEVASPVVDNPSDLMSQADVMALTASNLAVWGNAYWFKRRYLTQPGSYGFDVLNPELMSVELRAGGRGAYKVFHYAGTEYTADDVQHLMINPRHQAGSPLVMGAGFIQDNRAALQAMLDQARYANQWFVEAGYAPVYLTTDQDTDPERAAALGDAWLRLVASGRPPVLGNGYDVKSLALDPEQAQFVAIAQKNITDVARMSGVPARLMLASSGGSDTYANVQDDNRTFINSTLMPYVKAIENGLTAISPNGQTVKLNLDAFLRPDTKTRMETYAIGLQVGAYTQAEIRLLEDRPPLQEGDLPEAA